MNKIIKLFHLMGVIWGFLGFIFLLIFALIRLSDIAIDSFKYDYNFYHWIAVIINSLFMAYSEGYKGFQKSFSPRLAARLKYLYQKGNPIELILAPLFCMSFFNAPKKNFYIIIINNINNIFCYIFSSITSTMAWNFRYRCSYRFNLGLSSKLLFFHKGI